MKTQINGLLSGSKDQILNDNVDYSKFPQSTSTPGHAGSNRAVASEIYSAVTSENPEKLLIDFMGHTIELKANWSVSGKSCTYFGPLPEKLASTFFTLPKKGSPDIQIDGATDVRVSNGQNAFRNVCPSLITIL